MLFFMSAWWWMYVYECDEEIVGLVLKMLES